MDQSAGFFSINRSQLDAAVRERARRWVWYLVAGLAVTVLGLLLLINIFDAVGTLAVLVAIAVAMQGIDEIVNAWRYRPSWPGYVLGALYLITAVWAIAWPDITLWALAAVVGIGFVVSGVVQLVLVRRYHDEIPQRGWFVVSAVVTTLTGVLALVWPGATILVLAVLLGVRVLVEGLALVVFSFGLRELARA